MKISVIIPVYNVAFYVHQCLQSVFLQSMTEDVECLIVDDCSTDNSMDIVESVLKEYKDQSREKTMQIKVLHHATNRGLSAARNTGIKESQGEYIFFIDSDDYIYPNCLEQLWHFVSSHPNTDIVQGTMMRNNEKFQKWLLWPVTRYRVPEYSNNHEEIMKRFQMEQYLPMVQNRLIRRQFIYDNNLFFKEGFIYEDNIWTFLAGKYLNSIALCQEYTYYYRENPTSITSCSEEKGYIASCIVCDEILKEIDLFRNFKHELPCLLRHCSKVFSHWNRSPFVRINGGKSFLLKELYYFSYSHSSVWLIRNGHKMLYCIVREFLRAQLLANRLNHR